jgi:hypothetical protein
MDVSFFFFFFLKQFWIEVSLSYRVDVMIVVIWQKESPCYMNACPFFWVLWNIYSLNICLFNKKDVLSY